MTRVAPDGSPVDLYALLPERGEGELVAETLPSGSSILELGCGAGRITRQLRRLGFRVTAVDESAEMLAHVGDAETVEARIEELDLRRRFDAALLASNLFSVAPERRRAFLETCRRHASLAIVETLPLGWQPPQEPSLLGEVLTHVVVDRFEHGVAHGRVEYELGGRTWAHPFAMRVFADEGELAAALAEAGYEIERWLDAARGWFAARTDSR